MVKDIFSAKSLKRSAGSLAPELELFATALFAQRYAPSTVQKYVSECDAFNGWLRARKLSIVDANKKTIDRYLTVCTVGRRVSSSAAINAFVRHWQSINIVSIENAQDTELQRSLTSYREYLEQVRGVSVLTRKQYLFFANRFLRFISQNDTIDWSELNADRIAEFVRGDVAKRQGQGPGATTAAVRSFLRFLEFQGIVSGGLVAAVPTMRCWSQSSLPQQLSEKEILQILSVCSHDTAAGRRNHSILLLLARLGLRAQEVANLKLGDLDWVNGSISIRSSKTHWEREIPLMQDVAEAMLCYLQSGRPLTNHREIFVQHSAPGRPLGSSAITKIVNRMTAKAGIQSRSRGAHLFRHTVATRMVNSGATFKDVADLLGHQSLKTTAIYAKLDLETLAQIALPWPGGV